MGQIGGQRDHLDSTGLVVLPETSTCFGECRDTVKNLFGNRRFAGHTSTHGCGQTVDNLLEEKPGLIGLIRKKRQLACKPGSVRPGVSAGRDGHSSGTPVAGRLEQPTRTAARKPAWIGRTDPCRPYSVLLPVGFAVPAPLPETAVRSYRTLSPLPRLTPVGGLLSVALSLGSPPPGVTRHRVSMEPGLSSMAARRPQSPTPPPRPSGQLARLHKGIAEPGVKVTARMSQC